jgi:hypothetical protein
MPRRARVRSPRGAGVRPRRAALSTPASPRSNAVVVDGAPARRYCVIRRARPRATSQRATRAGLGDGPNLVHSSICRLWTLHNQSKKSFFALTFSRLRCTAASSVSATPPSNRLFSSSAQKTFQIRRKKVNDARPLPRRHSDPRSRATFTRLDLSRRRRALGQSAPPLFFSSQGRLKALASRSPRSRQAPPIAPIGLFVFPLQRRVRRS